jgi:hypothetical protein
MYVAATTTPPFVARVVHVTRVDLPYSYRPGCPVGPARLRNIRLRYWGFDNRPHLGTLVVNVDVTRAVVTVFRTLYAAHFPIRRMESVDAFHGNDNRSMAADNTSPSTAAMRSRPVRNDGLCTPTAKRST